MGSGPPELFARADTRRRRRARRRRRGDRTVRAGMKTQSRGDAHAGAQARPRTLPKRRKPSLAARIRPFWILAIVLLGAMLGRSAGRRALVSGRPDRHRRAARLAGLARPGPRRGRDRPRGQPLAAARRRAGAPDRGHSLRRPGERPPRRAVPAAVRRAGGDRPAALGLRARRRPRGDHRRRGARAAGRLRAGQRRPDRRRPRAGCPRPARRSPTPTVTRLLADAKLLADAQPRRAQPGAATAGAASRRSTSPG